MRFITPFCGNVISTGGITYTGPQALVSLHSAPIKARSLDCIYQCSTVNK